MMEAQNTQLLLGEEQRLPERQSGQKLAQGWAYHTFVILLGLLMLYPVFWLFSSSLKPADEIWTTVNSLIPSRLAFENFTNGWKGFGGYSFAVFYKNSFIYAGLATVFAVSTSTIVAYGFARVKFRGKNFWFTIMMMTLMLPTQVLIVPQYIVFSQLDWLNTFLPLLLPRLGGDVFFIFLIVQFVRGIPLDLDEAAMIDGANQFGVFFHVILPQLKPAVITAAIFSFYWTWEDFLTPLIYMTDPNLYTVSVALRAFSDVGTINDWGAVFAMLSLSLLPVFLLFVFFQRYIVEGIATTGLKG
ncbi:MAG TPA: carbohydrate ABC transporter permease [Phototrophicaceae bacterium]|nr:carbohydrate ABC transporter permease [Phototrophicaceae bacterium]